MSVTRLLAQRRVALAELRRAIASRDELAIDRAAITVHLLNAQINNQKDKP